MNQKSILFYVDHLDRFHLFKQFLPALNEQGYLCYFITIRLGIYWLAKGTNANPILVKKAKPSDYQKVTDLANSLEFLAGQLNQQEAFNLYSSFQQCLEKLNNKTNIETIFIWNGYDIGSIASKHFAKKYQISTLFFEVSNIDGKLFVDPEGTNAHSYLASNPEILDSPRFSTDLTIYKKWRENYLKDKTKPPIKNRKFSLLSSDPITLVINQIGFILGLSPKDSTSTASQKLKNLSKPTTMADHQYGPTTKPFIFLPLQVPTDTQILINSRIKNLQAIELASQLAKEKKLDLVIKIHPKSTDGHEISQVLTLKENLGFWLSNSPSLDLIKNSNEVITINSSVGLEALILEKDVQFLGNTFYSHLSENRLAAYIMKYLVNIDYFEKQPIARNTMNLVMERRDFNHLSP